MSGLAAPTPYNWNIGDVITQALLNGQLYNGLTFLLNPPVAMLAQSSAQSMANNAFTTITWPSPSLDTYGGWNSGSPTRYTPQQSGYYYSLGSIGYATSNAGGRICTTKLNGNFNSQTMSGAGSGNFNAVVQSSNFCHCNGSTDYLELAGNQDTGSAQNSVPTWTTWWIWWIHA
jgi:hypothetical protein